MVAAAPEPGKVTTEIRTEKVTAAGKTFLSRN